MVTLAMETVQKNRADIDAFLHRYVNRLEESLWNVLICIKRMEILCRWRKVLIFCCFNDKFHGHNRFHSMWIMNYCTIWNCTHKILKFWTKNQSFVVDSKFHGWFALKNQRITWKKPQLFLTKSFFFSHFQTKSTDRGDDSQEFPAVWFGIVLLVAVNR